LYHNPSRQIFSKAFSKHNVTGLLTISQDIENIMNVYMNIFLLLYADDTVLMAETPEDLQKQLNIFHDYSQP
jgi:hypothetical protein